MKKEQESLDGYLAYRIIKLEQKITAKYGKTLDYKETDGYRNLSLLEKRKFKKYLNQTKIKKIVGLFVVGILGMSSLLANSIITGNVLKNSSNSESVLAINYILIYIIIGLIVVVALVYLFKKILRRRFTRLFKIAEKPLK